MQLVNKEMSRATPNSAARLRIQTLSPWGLNGMKDKGLELFLDGGFGIGESQPSLKDVPPAKDSARELRIFTERSIDSKIRDREFHNKKPKTLRSVSSYSSSARFRTHKIGK